MMAHHADLDWAAGAFYSIDVFFVLSGFLITMLLAGEHERSGTIAIGAFYVRRALRLFPALVVLTVVLNVYILGAVFPEQIAELRRETVATLFYMANWALVFGLMDPIGFLGHAWTLAMEEQFYIVWPLVLRLMLSRLSRGAVLLSIAGAAATSAFLRWLLWAGPESFPRVYYGSDTRAEALLVGCLLALLCLWQKIPRTAGTRAALKVLSVAAIGVLAWMAAHLTVTSPFALRAGLSAAAIASAFLIAELHLDPAGPLARLFAFPPLVFVGRISYGLYLWHFPMFFWCAPSMTGLGFGASTVLRFAMTFAAGTASFYLIEKPFLQLKQRWSASPARAG